jgi:predicted Zn-dependent protease
MRRIIFIILVLAGLGAAIWFGRPAYQGYKEKRFAKQARTALAANEQRKALISAQQALVINSNNLAACQVMAALADLSRSPQALVWRRRVADIDPSLDNRLMMASCALRYEPPPFVITGQVLKEISDDGRDSVPFHLVSAQLAMKQNRIGEAENHFEHAIRLEPTNDLHRLNLAIVRLEYKDTAVAAKAHADLERLQASDKWSGHALRALVVHHMARREFAEAAQYSTLLLNGTNAAFGDRVEHLSVLHGAKSSDFDSFLSTIQRQATTNAIAAADVVSRMIALGLAAEAITWSKSLPPDLQKTMPLPPMIADCYTVLKRWREMEQFLNGQQWPESDFLRQALLAYALRNQNATDVASVHWNDAVQKAVERPESMLVLGQLSSKWNWTNETEAVLWRAARQFPKERWPIESLENSYAKMRNTRGLFEVNALLLQRQPTNAVAQNNWATLALLLQTNTAKAHQLARQVYERDTNNFGFVSTYAWSLHAQGRTADALKLIETLKPSELALPAVASYYGVILAAAGQTDKARQYLAKAETARILPEELNLIAQARRQL